MSTSCVPHNLNDCTKTGTGPTCTEDPRSDGGRAICMETVKQQCDERLKKCLETCQTTEEKAYNDRIKEGEERRKPPNYNNTCEQGDAYNKAWESARDHGSRSNAHGRGVFYKTRQEGKGAVLPGGFSSNTSGTQIGTSLYTNFWDGNPDNGGLNGHYYDGRSTAGMTAGYIAETKAFNDYIAKARAMCPPPPAPPPIPDDNPCFEKEYQEYQKKLANCNSQCYWSAVSDCDIQQCSCHLFKCPGPKVVSVGDGSTGGGSTAPTTSGPKRVEKRNTVGKVNFRSTSAYGIPIELVYSRAFMPGNIVWISDVSESRRVTDSVTFDAGLNTFTTTYNTTINNLMDMYVALGAGEIDAVSRVWIGGSLVYDKSSDAAVIVENQDQVTLRHMTGSESQKVRKNAADQEGFGRVPAYRGTSYLAVDDLNLSKFKDFPTFKVEVVKSITDQAELSDSGEFDTLAPTGLFRVDTGSRRIFVKSADGMSAVNLDTLETVWTYDITDAVDVTPMGKIVTYDGTFNTLNWGFTDLASGSYEAETFATVNHWIFRTVTSLNETYTALCTNENGFIEQQDIDDTRGTFPEEISNFSNDLTTTAGFATPARLIRPDTASTSLSIVEVATVYLGVGFNGAPDPDYLELTLMAQYGEDTNYVIAVELPNETPETTVGYGLIACAYDGSLIAFYNDRATKLRLTGRSTLEQVWDTQLAAGPSLGRYPARDWLSESQTFSYIDRDGDAQTLDLETGVETPLVVGTIPAAMSAGQYYDAEARAIIYAGTDDKLHRLYLERITVDRESIADIINDLAARSDIDVGRIKGTDLETTYVTGFRSGAATSAREVLDQLFDIYPSVVSADGFMTVKRILSGDTVSVDEADAAERVAITRSMEVYDTTYSKLTYYSDDLVGEQNTQNFDLPDDRFIGRDGLELTYTILETDAYMRGLAELKVFARQDSDRSASIHLPPSFIGIVPGDTLSLSGGLRVKSIEIGADNSVMAILSSDQIGKYAEAATLTGVSGVRVGSLSSKDVPDSLSGPFLFSMRSVEQVARHEGMAYIGGSNTLGEFNSDTTFGLSDSEAATVVGAPAKRFTKSPVWGAVVTPPPTLTTAFFRTFPTQTFTVKFASVEYAERILLSFYSQFYIDGPHYTTFDARLNLFAVGKEYIQAQAVSQDDVDPTLLTFSILLRARQNTDDFTAHTAGELCVFIERDTLLELSIDPTDAYKTLRGVASIPGQTPRRRNDVYPDYQAFYPLHNDGITRLDVTPFSDLSVLNPDNPHVIIEFNYRVPHATGLLPEVVELLDFTTPRCEIYLLRAAYDPVLFDAARNNTLDLSYIMIREHVTAANTIIETGDTEYLGYVWKALYHDDAAWDAATEPLVVVIIDVNDWSETRSVRSWNVGGDFTRRRARGL